MTAFARWPRHEFPGRTVDRMQDRLVLVLFAVLCGEFVSRTDDSSTFDFVGGERQVSSIEKCWCRPSDSAGIDPYISASNWFRIIAPDIQGTPDGRLDLKVVDFRTLQTDFCASKTTIFSQESERFLFFTYITKQTLPRAETVRRQYCRLAETVPGEGRSHFRTGTSAVTLGSWVVSNARLETHVQLLYVLEASASIAQPTKNDAPAQYKAVESRRTLAPR